MAGYRKILIVKPSSLGDIIHSLPVLYALKKRYPSADIHWVIAKGFEGILEGHPLIRKLWVIDKDTWKRVRRVHSSVSEIRRLAAGLRNERYDCVVDLQGLLRSAVIAKLTGSQLRIGFSDAREGAWIFYNRTVTGGKDIHAVDRYLKIAAALGCDITDVRFPLPPPKPPAEVPVPGLIPGMYVVMAPGARGAPKRWPAGRFGEVAAALPLRTIVIGSRGDAALGREVEAASGGKALSIAGKTGLPALVEVIRQSSLMVCNDTGPMHIAAALGVPVVALFGPTNPAQTGPYGTLQRVIRAGSPCAPCYRKGCKTMECMTMIKVKEVQKAVNELLSGR